MNEKIRTHLKNAFAFLSKIPVTDDNQERMFFAKEELRKAWALTEETDDTEVKNDG